LSSEVEEFSEER